MWIFLGIVAFLAAVIFTLLMLPIHFIIKTDENGELFLRYTFLGKVYGENPDPDSPLLQTLKKVSGVSRLEKGNFREDTKKIGVTKQSVSNWENDNIQPSIDMLVKIARALNVSTDYLLALDDRKYLDVTGLSDSQIGHLQLIICDIINKDN